jgi:hypothetical protein
MHGHGLVLASFSLFFLNKLCKKVMVFRCKAQAWYREQLPSVMLLEFWSMPSYMHPQQTSAKFRD